MTKYSDPNYDPGFLNSPGKGQSVGNPLAPSYIRTLGIAEDLSVYGDIFANGPINSNTGFTLGYNNYFSYDGFRWSSSGRFTSNITFESECYFDNQVFFDNDIYVGDFTNTRKLRVNGREYRATRIKCDNGTFTVLATF